MSCKAATFSTKASVCATISSKVFFSIDTISIYKTIFEFAAKVTARAETPIGFV